MIVKFTKSIIEPVAYYCDNTITINKYYCRKFLPMILLFFHEFIHLIIDKLLFNYLTIHFFHDLIACLLWPGFDLNRKVMIEDQIIKYKRQKQKEKCPNYREQ